MRGRLQCARCQGELWTRDELSERTPGVLSELRAETDQRSGAFAHPRQCPYCQAPLAPWRLGRAEAWLDRCGACDVYWLEKQDVRTLAALGRRAVRAAAVASLPAAERRELTAALAEDARGGAATYELSPVHALLAAFGLPVVTGTKSHRAPVATWMLALALVAVHILALRNDDPAAFVDELALHSNQPTLLSALTACVAHAGWLHLLGNTYFLVAFGDGVEQRLPRWVLVPAFFTLGAAALALDVALTQGPTAVVGASGGVAVLMGACFVFHPRARVVTRLGAAAVLPMPMWLYGLFEVGFQALMASLHVRGVAWIAHLAGLALGALLAALLRFTGARRLLVAAEPE